MSKAVLMHHLYTGLVSALGLASVRTLCLHVQELSVPSIVQARRRLCPCPCQTPGTPTS